MACSVKSGIHRVNHSKNAIVKPQGKTAEVAQKEVEEAMRKAREAQQAIAKTLEPGGLLLVF